MADIKKMESLLKELLASAEKDSSPGSYERQRSALLVCVASFIEEYIGRAQLDDVREDHLEAAIVMALSSAISIWIAGTIKTIPGGMNSSIARNRLAHVLSSLTRIAASQLASEFTDPLTKGTA